MLLRLLLLCVSVRLYVSDVCGKTWMILTKIHPDRKREGQREGEREAEREILMLMVSANLQLAAVVSRVLISI